MSPAVAEGFASQETLYNISNFKLLNDFESQFQNQNSSIT